MNEVEQSPWTLLHRPWWKPVLGLASCFGVLLFISDASLSSPLQVGVALAAALGYIFLYDGVRLLIERFGTRRSIRIASGLTGIGLALWLIFLITQWGEALSAPRYVIISARFSITIAITAACGSAFQRPKQPSGGNT